MLNFFLYNIAMDKVIAVIDLKAFYSYVECLDRGLDPFSTPLVVADISRSVNTIILSVTPYLKSKGVPSRLRVKELPKGYDYVYATPRMERYLEMSARVVDIFLDFFAEEDIHVYSIDEAFINLTPYLSYYKKTPKEIVVDIIDEIKSRTGLKATAGIGDNFFLAKVALDIYAKKSGDGIAIMHKEDVQSKLWPITPLSKIWGIGSRLEKRLNDLGIFNVAALACSNREFIHNKFGIMGDQLIDCANGIDESDIREEYVPKTKSLSIGQTLPRNYNYIELETVIIELIDDLTLRMRNENKATELVYLMIGYASDRGGFAKQMSLLSLTDDTEIIRKAILEIYRNNVKDLPIRNVYISFGKLAPTRHYQQLSLFDDTKRLEKQHQFQLVSDLIHNKYGKNMLLRASALTPSSTAIERHNQIGGHHR